MKLFIIHNITIFITSIITLIIQSLQVGNIKDMEDNLTMHKKWLTTLMFHNNLLNVDYVIENFVNLFILIIKTNRMKFVMPIIIFDLFTRSRSLLEGS